LVFIIQLFWGKFGEYKQYTPKHTSNEYKSNITCGYKAR